MKWEEKLKNIAKKYNNQGSDSEKNQTHKAQEDARKFSIEIYDKFNFVKDLIESSSTEVEVEKTSQDNNRFLCSIQIRSYRHNKFKYIVIVEVLNDLNFNISKEYIDGWVINGPIEEKKVNISKDWNEKSCQAVINRIMDDFTDSYEFCLNESTVS